MKKILITLSLIVAANTSHAWIKPDKNQVYNFKFKLSGESFNYHQKAPTFEEAYRKAAQACFNHFKSGQQISEERGLDIIDVCANPRS